MRAMLAKLDAPIARADRNIAHLVEQLDQEALISMLEWISPIPFDGHHHTVKEKRTSETGQWILQDETFRDWERRVDTSIFILEGTAGTGKTYLTSTVIERLKKEMTTAGTDEGIAYFYCDKNEPVRTQPLSIFQSFVRQLATPVSILHSVQTALKTIYGENRRKGLPF
jgi:Cdc6-like AAA superfamily ATPase